MQLHSILTIDSQASAMEAPGPHNAQWLSYSQSPMSHSPLSPQTLTHRSTSLCSGPGSFR
eukprot:6276800-Prymnesium_polylepis.1